MNGMDGGRSDKLSEGNEKLCGGEEIRWLSRLGNIEEQPGNMHRRHKCKEK